MTSVFNSLGFGNCPGLLCFQSGSGACGVHTGKQSIYYTPEDWRGMPKNGWWMNECSFSPTFFPSFLNVTTSGRVAAVVFPADPSTAFSSSAAEFFRRTSCSVAMVVDAPAGPSPSVKGGEGGNEKWRHFNRNLKGLEVSWKSLYSSLNKPI